MNTLLYLLEKYPDLPWDCEYFSSNPNIPIKYIKNNLDKNWNWVSISCCVTYEEFIDNQDLPWDYIFLSGNRNIPLDYIKNNLYDNTNVNLYKNWNWFDISYRVTYEEFINNPDLYWIYNGLSENRNIPIECIKNNLDKEWNWIAISIRVTYEEFIDNPTLPWDYYSLSMNRNIPLEYIKNNINEKWYWFYISGRVTYEEFIDNPDLPWDYEQLSENISLKYIINNLDIWDCHYISERVTYEEFINNQTLPWNYFMLSINNNIPLDYIKNNLYVNRNANLNDDSNVYFNKGWDWFYISKRVTYKEFIDNPDLPWDYSGLSYNKFDYKSRVLAKDIMNIIINDEKYIAKVYNPNRIRSYKSICELEELKSEFGWTDEEFNKYVK